MALLYGFAPANFPLCATAPCAFGLQQAGSITGPNLTLAMPCQASAVGASAYFQSITIAPGGCLLLGFFDITVSDTIRVTVGS